MALRLHKQAPAAPDAYARARMRARVMTGLRPRKPTLRDNAWTALELLGRPAPYIVRGVALGAVLLTLGMGAVVSSAETLPDDLLYPVKIATEQVRLALADAPGDRAGVELSIAEHRLAEAERLAGSGRTSDALVASAMFSQHIASAAAELAPQPETDLGAQLETAFNAQRDRAQALATTLESSVQSARGAQVLALIAAPSVAPGATRLERIAETAASVAGVLADAADVAAAENANIATPPPSGTAKRSETPPAAFAARTETPRATEAEHATPTASTAAATPTAAASARADRSSDRGSEKPSPSAAHTRDPRASDAAKITRKAADDARATADKLKQTLKDQHR